MANKSTSEKSYTILSVEKQKAIRGWGGPRPPRIQTVKTPNRKEK